MRYEFNINATGLLVALYASTTACATPPKKPVEVSVAAEVRSPALPTVVPAVVEVAADPIEPVEVHAQFVRSENAIADAIVHSGGCVMWTFENAVPIEMPDPDQNDLAAMARYRAAEEFLRTVEFRERHR